MKKAAGIVVLGLLTLSWSACDSGDCTEPADTGSTDVSGDQASDVAGTDQRGTDALCDNLPAVVPLGACLVEVGQVSLEPPYSVNYSVEGSVTAMGEGVPPDNCFLNCTHVGECLSGAALDSAVWARVVDDQGKEWTLAYVIPSPDPLLAIGQAVSLTYSWQDEPFAPTPGLLRVDSGDKVLLWIATGSSPEEFTPPGGLAFKKGDSFCPASDECGSWTHYSMDVTLGDLSGVAGYRTHPLHIGAYNVFNAGIVSAFGAPSECLDWFVADAQVAVWPALPCQDLSQAECEATEHCSTVFGSALQEGCTVGPAGYVGCATSSWLENGTWVAAGCSEVETWAYARAEPEKLYLFSDSCIPDGWDSLGQPPCNQ